MNDNPCSCCGGKGFHGLFSTTHGRWCEPCRGTGREEICIQEAEADPHLLAVLHAAKLLMWYEDGPRDEHYHDLLSNAFHVLREAVQAAQARIAGSS